MAERVNESFKVVIAGAGVAGLEAALALRDLAGDRLAITIVDPASEFVYRPMRVREPFAGPEARHYPLAEIADDIGVELRHDSFKWLAPSERALHTEGGDRLVYDALLLALGARRGAHFHHALTLDDHVLDEQLQGLIRDVEEGYARRIAFIAPDPMPWPLPLYELALMTARRAWEMDEAVEITLVTPEDSPLALFGGAVSEAVRGLLDKARIRTVTGAHCLTRNPGEVLLGVNGPALAVDRIIALPELFGPPTPGVPKSSARGFIQVDTHCRVTGLESVFAAGDATDFPVKFGGIAAQQADVAAASIAAMAGVAVEPVLFNPLIHGMLLGGDRPLYLTARIAGSHGVHSEVSHEPAPGAAGKIAARYLAPYLESRDRAL